MKKDTWRSAVSGAAAGAANGLFGGGGGSVLVPLLTRFCGLEQRQAFSTSLAVILPLCVLSAAVYLVRGGLDLAALTGFYLGCAYWRIPVVLDGLITGAAALAAVKICPAVADYLLASHVSAEPAGQAVLSSLGLKAAIQAGMCLGEGTGAAAFFPMLDMALTIYSKMDTFQDIQVKPYCHFEEDKNEDKE